MSGPAKRKLKTIGDALFKSVSEAAGMRTAEVVSPVDVRVLAVSVQTIADELWKLAEELED